MYMAPPQLYQFLHLHKQEKLMEEQVNHPKHYTFGKFETIDVIEDWKLGIHEASVVKYICRAKHKGNELQDLKKAEFYLHRKILLLEKGL